MNKLNLFILLEELKVPFLFEEKKSTLRGDYYIIGRYTKKPSPPTPPQMHQKDLPPGFQAQFGSKKSLFDADIQAQNFLLKFWGKLRMKIDIFFLRFSK